MGEQLDLFGKPLKIVKPPSREAKLKKAMEIIERMESKLSALSYLINVERKKSR